MNRETGKQIASPLCGADSAATLDVGSLDTASSSLTRARTGERPIDFAELRRQITMQQVLDLLQLASRSSPRTTTARAVPGASKRRRTQPQLRRNLEKRVFRCFKPGCPAKGNQLDLYALATGLPILEASHQLCERLGIAAPVLPQTKPERRNP